MDLKELQKHWHTYGEEDPMWAILTVPELKGQGWDSEAFFQKGELEIAEQLTHVASLGVSLRTGRALDFGCGIGRLTQALCLHFDECHGVDIAPSMIEKAREFNKHGNRCQYHVNDKDDLALFADNTFDFIYSVIVLQHMRPEYARRYIQEFLRVLAPGGMLIFQIPSELVEPPLPAPEIAPEPPQTKRPLSLLPRLRNFYMRGRNHLPAKTAVPQPFQPRMEMYAISQNEIEQIVQNAGNHIKDIQQDGWAGPAWISYTYYIL